MTYSSSFQVLGDWNLKSSLFTLPGTMCCPAPCPKKGRPRVLDCFLVSPALFFPHTRIERPNPPQARPYSCGAPLVDRSLAGGSRGAPPSFFFLYEDRVWKPLAPIPQSLAEAKWSIESPSAATNAKGQAHV